MTRPRNSEFDLMLEILDRVRPRGTPLTEAVIADVLGCSKAYVWQVQRRSLGKMRGAAERRRREGSL
jgi:hypothetical protein